MNFDDAPPPPPAPPTGARAPEDPPGAVAPMQGGRPETIEELHFNWVNKETGQQTRRQLEKLVFNSRGGYVKVLYVYQDWHRHHSKTEPGWSNPRLAIVTYTKRDSRRAGRRRVNDFYKVHSTYYLGASVAPRLWRAIAAADHVVFGSAIPAECKHYVRRDENGEPHLVDSVLT